jgi:hypothetical protein
MKLKTLFVIGPTLALLFLAAGSAVGQEILFEEHFTGGSTDLEWNSVWTDSLGNPLTPMTTDSVPLNPSGDGWIGIVNSDTTLGNIGLAVAGDASLTDYSMEAQVWIDPSSGWYLGIMMRTQIDTVTGRTYGYQLIYSPFLSVMRFRYYVSIPDDIITIREWDSTEIPGGVVTTPSWHTMKIDAQGDLFFCYWDDQLLPGSPLVDATLTWGIFGMYCFDVFGPVSIGCDDIIIEGEPPTGAGDTTGDVSIPRAFNLSQNYPNPFNPMTTIRVDIPAGETKHADLSIYDLRGRRVRTLVDKPLNAGTHFFAWDGRDDAGRSVPSGTYIYRMKRGEDQYTRKMLLMK